MSKCLEQDTETQIAPAVQLAPCIAASAISEGPAMSWRLPSPRDSWDWPQQTPPPPSIKVVTHNGWMGLVVSLD